MTGFGRGLSESFAERLWRVPGLDEMYDSCTGTSVFGLRTRSQGVGHPESFRHHLSSRARSPSEPRCIGLTNLQDFVGCGGRSTFTNYPCYVRRVEGTDPGLSGRSEWRVAGGSVWSWNTGTGVHREDVRRKSPKVRKRGRRRTERDEPIEDR